MAEPIGVASGALSPATFAFNSSISLYQMVKSFQSSKRDIRELQEELEALKIAIQSLQGLASKDEVQFEPLRLPLHRCGKTCEEFEKVIANCTKNSSNPKTSFRDWAKLQYMGKDIAGSKNMLAGYKSTIIIAIGDVNLRTAVVSANAIQEFKEMLANTTTDLEEHHHDLQEHLQNIDDKLDALGVQEFSKKDEEIAEKRRISEETESVKECLAICNHAAKHIDEARTNVFEDVSAAEDAHQVIVSTFGDLISAKRVTAGVRATQLLGQMSDATLQQLARSQGCDLSSLLGTVKDVEE
ncbi:uncharacterized protein BDZ99DRAFT_468700 [Mytilinidion resinicola]|uniref:Azaphilone pigments biosynthesis cluster protein L N-terminal domain-containing protein n=1 Tax=Mytilinidion resinicola TaxID=574789 RepID=A0A6A6Y1N4_9PEZI|nr:uncharacterized protein BDZ99DRAFT_468700 [Mytilinidion resinicola]KAF2802726.1 hypothetical protein BDZ99DRAFT_468700 [Mytilinidion resinicola]